jgi:Tfp pilus assembly protein PilX
MNGRRVCAFLWRRASRLAPLGDESGFVLVVALLILVVVVALIGVTAIAAQDSSDTSVRGAAQDRALAAADAGAQVALFRLNTTGSTGATGTMGNGATYSYTVSPLSSSSSPCAGLWVQSSGQSVQQACITSSGTVHGYTTRVEDRVVAYTPPPPTFPVNGMFAINGFTVGNNFTGDATIATNGQMSFAGGSNSITGGLEYPSGEPPTGYTCTGSCVPMPQASPITVPTGPSPSAYANAASSNKDAAITNWGGLNFSGTTGANAYELEDASTGTANPVTFPPGTYYFCDVNAANTNTVTFNAAASASPSNPVIIYVDSPSRAGSNCPAGTGNFAAGFNKFNITGIAGEASAFQIYVSGTPGCTTTCSDILSKNNGTYQDIEVFAPNSQLNSKNGATLQGNFVIGTVTTGNNGTLDYIGPGNGSGNGGTYPTYYPSAHQICAASPSSSC